MRKIAINKGLDPVKVKKGQGYVRASTPPKRAAAHTHAALKLAELVQADEGRGLCCF